MTQSGADALYVYAVLPEPGAGVPVASSILAGSRVGSLAEAGLSALVSVVPRALFEHDSPESRACDPGWVAVCAEAHHRVVALASAQGACLPFGFGTVFSTEASLRAWLSEKSCALRKTLEIVADRQEWALTLLEDAQAHAAWLQSRVPQLRNLQDLVGEASPGTGFLLERRLERERDSARAQHAQEAASRLSERLYCEGFAARRESSPQSAACGCSWSVLAPRKARFAERLAGIGAGLFDGTGLSLRITGPWPPYAFARAAWQEHGDA
jgi:hypothetical protein